MLLHLKSNVPYNVIKSRYQEKSALPTSVPMLPTEINGQSNFHVFKKQTESAICQSLNNPRMGFSVLYKSRNSKSTILKPETTMFSKGLLTMAVYFAAPGSFAVDEVLLVII